jgi:hypothetical protein
VEFAYNVTRALGIEHSPFEAVFGFFHEEPPYRLFNMRPSVLISQDAIERFKLLQELHAMVRSMLHLHKEEMQARSEPSTTPHFVRVDKVNVFTKNIFLPGQPNRKLLDRQLGPFTIEEEIRKHSCILKLPTTVRLHPVLHVNSLRPCSISSHRLAIAVTTPERDDDEFEVSHISAVCIKS